MLTKKMQSRTQQHISSKNNSDNQKFTFQSNPNQVMTARPCGCCADLGKYENKTDGTVRNTATVEVKSDVCSSVSYQGECVCAQWRW